jgi:hypothetical protein
MKSDNRNFQLGDINAIERLTYELAAEAATVEVASTVGIGATEVSTTEVSTTEVTATGVTSAKVASTAKITATAEVAAASKIATAEVTASGVTSAEAACGSTAEGVAGAGSAASVAAVPSAHSGLALAAKLTAKLANAWLNDISAVGVTSYYEGILCGQLPHRCVPLRVIESHRGDINRFRGLIDDVRGVAGCLENGFQSVVQRYVF